MESNTLSNFSILKAFSDSGRNILDCLIPFVEFGIASIGTEYMYLSQIKDEVLNNCDIDIPLNTLKTLLKRLKRENRITDYDNWQYIRLVGNFARETNTYNNEIQKFNRDVNQFVAKYRDHYSLSDSDDEIIELVCSFIQIYQTDIDVSALDFELRHQQPIDDTFRKVANYISHISTYDDQSYSTFKNIFFGYLLRQFIKKGQTDISPKIKNLTVYVDSNFLLRTLDMQARHFTTTSRELMDLFKSHGIEVAVLIETVSEVRTTLSKHTTRFSSNRDTLLKMHSSRLYELDGIEGAFFRRKMSITDAHDFVEDLEKHITNEHINIHRNGIGSSTHYDEEVKNMIVERKKKKENTSNIKDLSKREKIEHAIEKKSILDAQIIAYINKKRKGKKYKLEKCEHLFLTCDNILHSVNSSMHRHESSSIPECMNEVQLTNSLYMSNPQAGGNASIKLFLSIFNASNYLEYDHLQKFHKDLNGYFESKPDEGQLLGQIFRNQKLFQDIYGQYSASDNDSASDLEFISTLVENAKSETEETKLQIENEVAESYSLSKELLAENADLKQKLEDVIAKNNDLLFASEDFTGNDKNISAEKILKTLIGIIETLICLGGIISFVLLANVNNFSLTREWINDALLPGIIPVFAFTFVGFFYRYKGNDTAIQKFVYADTASSIFKMLLHITGKTAFAVLLVYVLPVSLHLLS